MKRKLLLIRDNTHKTNWGCRATSIALSQLLSDVFQVRRLKPYHDIKYRIAVPGHIDVVTDSALESAELLLSHRDFSEVTRDIIESILDADIVAINLEGCGIFCTPYRRDLAFVNMIIALANSLSKKVVVVNGMLSDCPQTGRNEHAVSETVAQFNSASGVFLRDPTSADLADSLGIRAQFLPDALFYWADRYEDILVRPRDRFYEEMFDGFPENPQRFRGRRLPEDYVCVSGASFHPSKDTSGYYNFFRHLVRELSDLPLVLIAPGGDYFLERIADEENKMFVPSEGNILLNAALLANSKGYISGRYHPSIMASLGGTPSVFLESNSHKTSSLQRVLSYGAAKEHPIIDSDNNLALVTDDLRTKLHNYEKLNEHLRNESQRHAKSVADLASMIENRTL